MPATDPSSFVTDAELIAAYPVFIDDAWLVTVTGSADDTYVVTVAGVPYSHGPTVGEAIAQIRDGLLASMDSTVQGLFDASADDDNQIALLSNVGAVSLAVETSPDTLYASVVNGFSPADRQCALDLTKCMICASTWGCNTWRGHLAATAHYLKMWGRSRNTAGTGATGQTTGMTQGPYSQSWGTVTPTDFGDSWWANTPEGQQFVSIRRALGTFARGMVMGGRCRR